MAFVAAKETMRRPILNDILNVLLLIRKTSKSDEIDGFIMNALSGEMLNNKLKKQIRKIL